MMLREKAALERNPGRASGKVMLRALAIRDFVIAERIELETGAGFGVSPAKPAPENRFS
jgi:hypothetical protein